MVHTYPRGSQCSREWHDRHIILPASVQYLDQLCSSRIMKIHYCAVYAVMLHHFNTVYNKRPKTPLTFRGSSCANVKSTAILNEKAAFSLQKY